METAKHDDENLSGRVYSDLKKQIIELSLQPEECLLERSLANSLGTSRTPIREALKRLEQDGWVYHQDKRRIAVRGINMKDVKEVFMLRSMVEIFAIATIFDSLEPRALAGKLVPIVTKMKESVDDRVDFIKEDMNFHSEIIFYLDNVRLNGMWDRIKDEVTRIALFSFPQQRRPETVISEHEALVDAFWGKDAALASSKMEEHFQRIFLAYEDKFRELESSSK